MAHSNQLPPLIMNPKSLDNMSAPRARAVEATYKPAKQKRSAKSEQKLLNAAEALFAEKGFEGTKISDIIKRSGCSIGSFYHRFGDKDGLAKVMVDRYLVDAKEKIDASDFSRAKHLTLSGMLAHLAALVLEFQNSRLGVYRAAQRLAQSAPEIWFDTGNLTIRVRNRVADFLPDYADAITAEDKEKALSNAVQLIVLVILQTRLGSGILFPKDDEALLAMLVDAAMGVLRPGVE